MASIIKVLGWANHDSYATVTVQLDDGSEGEVFVGGAAEVYFHHGKIKVFVKKTNH